MVPSDSLMQKMAEVVPRLFQAQFDYEERNGFDPEITQEEAWGPVCTPAEIEALEQFLGQALPPSYCAFLLQFGRWDSMPGCGGAVMLGPADFKSKHIQDTVNWKGDLFKEFEGRNPFDEGAIPLAIGGDRNSVLLEGPPRPDGERDVVKYYLTEEEGRFPDLVSYFEKQIDMYNKL